MKPFIKPMRKTLLHLITGFVLCFTLAWPALGNAGSLVLQPLTGRQGEIVALDAVAVNSPVTLQSRFQVSAQDDLSKLQGAWLAGFGAGPNTPPTLLSVTWSEERSAWFPVWTLHLQSDANLLPDSLKLQDGQDFTAGAKVIKLTSQMPQPGHEILTRLSYDPVSGRADLDVTDLTANSRIYAGTFMLQPFHGKLYPAAGLVDTANSMEVRQFTATPRYVPVGTAWDLMIKENNAYQRLMVTRFAQGPDLALQMGANTLDLPGRFRLTVDDAKTAKQLLDLPANAHSAAVLHQFAAEDVPLGQVNLRLAYVDEGEQEWPLGQVAISTVAANLKIDFGPLNMKKGFLSGLVTVKSEDQTLYELPIRLYATFSKPGSEGRSSDTRLIYEQRLAKVSPEPVVLSFTVPIDGDVDFDEAIFGLNLSAEFDRPVGKNVTGSQFYVVKGD